MRRLFWLALGAAAGVYAVRRLTRKAERFTPDGLANQVAHLGGVIRTVGEEVRAQMAVREQELRTGLGIEEPGATDTGNGSRTGSQSGAQRGNGRAPAGDGRHGRRRDIG